MSSYFTFEGTVNSLRKFEIEVIADTYEQARDLAYRVLDDNTDRYYVSDPEIEIEIDTYDEEPVPYFR